MVSQRFESRTFRLGVKHPNNPDSAASCGSERREEEPQVEEVARSRRV